MKLYCDIYVVHFLWGHERRQQYQGNLLSLTDAQCSDRVSIIELRCLLKNDMERQIAQATLLPCYSG